MNIGRKQARFLSYFCQRLSVGLGALLCVCQADWRQETGREIVRLANGDILFGNLVSIKQPDQFIWRHPDAKKEIQFELTQIKDLRFSDVFDETFLKDSSHEITLVNGDVIQATVLNATPEHVTIQSWYLGSLNLPWEAISILRPTDRSGRSLWDGIANLEGWTKGKIDAPGYETGEWTHNAGAIYATKMASLARNLDLPNEARIEMDIHWRGSLYLAIALFTDHWEPIKLADQHRQTEPDFGGFYSLYFTRSTAGLRSVTKPKVKNFPYRGIPGLAQTNVAHIEILASKKKGELGLVVNGKPIQPWRDNEGFIGEGRGMRFVHQGQGAIKITNFKIREWDGTVGDDNIESNNLDQDLLVTRDGSRYQGFLSGLTENQLLFKQGEIEAPHKWRDVKAVALAPRARSPRQAPVPDIRLEDRHGGYLNLKLHSWSPTSLEASHENLGSLTLHPAAVKEIQFLPPSK